ncbi:TIGR04255 family protein [Acidobacteria bacterium AH-259-D05]|nr:TIGR04255 family protein [Acidobacteria bacterium AH-259-D05]
MPKPKKRIKALPDYKNPPVGEVACGIRFEPLRNFKAPHAGLFWERIRNNFPKCEHASPIGLTLTSALEVESLPLPRIWFISENGENLIQIQNDRFHFNWRKRSDEEKYPRYEYVIRAFRENFKTFKEFVREAELGPLNPLDCELLYANYILQGAGWKAVKDIRKILPDLSWKATRERFLADPLQIGWQISVALPEEQGLLSISLKQGSRRPDKVPLFVLELVARGLGEDKSDPAIRKWFKLAHEWIVRGFADLTSVKAQKELWDRVDI